MDSRLLYVEFKRPDYIPWNLSVLQRELQFDWERSTRDWKDHRSTVITHAAGVRSGASSWGLLHMITRVWLFPWISGIRVMAQKWDTHRESVSIPVSICTANQIVILFTLPPSFFIINVFFWRWNGNVEGEQHYCVSVFSWWSHKNCPRGKQTEGTERKSHTFNLWLRDTNGVTLQVYICAVF